MACNRAPCLAFLKLALGSYFLQTWFCVSLSPSVSRPRSLSLSLSVSLSFARAMMQREVPPTSRASAPPTVVGRRCCKHPQGLMLRCSLASAIRNRSHCNWNPRKSKQVECNQLLWDYGESPTSCKRSLEQMVGLPLRRNGKTRGITTLKNCGMSHFGKGRPPRSHTWRPALRFCCKGRPMFNCCLHVGQWWHRTREPTRNRRRNEVVQSQYATPCIMH